MVRLNRDRPRLRRSAGQAAEVDGLAGQSLPGFALVGVEQGDGLLVGLLADRPDLLGGGPAIPLDIATAFAELEDRSVEDRPELVGLLGESRSVRATEGSVRATAPRCWISTCRNRATCSGLRKAPRPWIPSSKWALANSSAFLAALALEPFELGEEPLLPVSHLQCEPDSGHLGLVELQFALDDRIQEEVNPPKPPTIPPRTWAEAKAPAEAANIPIAIKARHPARIIGSPFEVRVDRPVL